MATLLSRPPPTSIEGGAKSSNCERLNWSYQSHFPGNDNDRPVFASDYTIMFSNVLIEHFDQSEDHCP